MEQNNSRIIPFPVAKVKKSKRSKSQESYIGKGLDDATMHSLASAFSNPADERDFRNRALFLLMSKTALRASEVVSLSWSNLITLPEGIQAFRVVAKGAKCHIVVPGAEAIIGLREYNEKIGNSSDHIFYSLPLRSMEGLRTKLSARGLQKIINGWGAKTGLNKKIHPHALRHTAIQKAFDVGGSIAAQKLAGHSSPNVTSKHYTRSYIDCSSILSW